MSATQSGRPRVGLFVTCLADLMRPSVGFASVRLIELAGCEVEVPRGQTCCGQPAYNAGDRADARAIAANTIRAFEGFDYVVAPSGSCTAMLKLHYPALFKDEPEMLAAAQNLAGRVHELTSFLADVRKLEGVPGRFQGRVTYHDACSGLRELGLKEAPRRLLAMVPGLTLAEMEDSDVCCGFGGLFSLKYPDVSNAMVEKKASAATAVAPDLILGGDLGCLMNIAGKLARQGSPIACRHIAEVLAGELADPPIAKPA